MKNEPTPLEKMVIDNIRRIRQKKGISQLRLSVFSGTSASYIGLMETYKNIPKLSTIERIADALNVPVLDLFSENQNSEDSKKIQKNKDKKQKIRDYLKDEILNRMSKDLDELLQII